MTVGSGLGRSMESKEPGLWKDLYVSLVRPHLEYAVQVWNPYLQGDIDKIERVQRRATRVPTGFEKFEYEDRLKKLSMTTLKDRRIPLNLRKNVDISGPEVSVRGNSLSI